jgi:hypothetical protein
LSRLRGPGAKETEETHAGLAAPLTPRSSTDLARNDQRSHAALGEIVLSWHARDRHKDEQLGQEAFDALTSGTDKSYLPCDYSVGLCSCRMRGNLLE